MTDFYKTFPTGLREKMLRLNLLGSGITELRFRCNAPLIFLKGKEELFLHNSKAEFTNQIEEAYVVNVNEIRELVELISNYSLYAFENEVRQGFLTMQGGHRVGICGKVVLQDGKIKTIRNISFLNIRLAKEWIGCADAVLPYLFDGERLCHTLLVSPPGCGKTTLLRDLIRQLSNGSLQNIRGQGANMPQNKGFKIGVVDERGEIAACHNGIPQNDLGIRTDVLDGCLKTLGMELLLRSMSPDIIAVDELGTYDVGMIKKCMFCGCRILATAHGEGYEEWFLCGGKESRVPEIPFERYIFLKGDGPPGKISAVCDGMGEVLWE